MKKTLTTAVLLASLFLPAGYWSREEGWKPKQLTACVTGMSGNPLVSADGKSVYFISTCDLVGENRDYSPEVFRWRGGRFTQLTDSLACAVADLALSHSGKTLAFASSCGFDGLNPGRGAEIFLRNESGKLERLTEGMGYPSEKPVFSPDDRRLVFLSHADLTEQYLNLDASKEVFALDLESPREIKQLTSTRGAGKCDSLDFLTDSIVGRCNIDFPGTRIQKEDSLPVTVDGFSVGGNPDRNFELFNFHPSGEVSQLTYTSLCEIGPPVVQPGGRLLAFTSNCPLGKRGEDDKAVAELYLRGVEIIRPFPNVEFSGSSMQWSGDGKSLVFTSTMDPKGKNRDKNAEIFVLETPLGRAELVESFYRGKSLPDALEQVSAFDSGGSDCPSISNDGSVVVFVSSGDPEKANPEGNGEIFMAAKARGGDDELEIDDSDGGDGSPPDNEEESAEDESEDY